MTSISIPQLRELLTGRVIAPDDEDYDRARTLVYGGFDLRPAAITRVAHADDVARVVAFARESGVELAQRLGARGENVGELGPRAEARGEHPGLAAEGDHRHVVAFVCQVGQLVTSFVLLVPHPGLIFGFLIELTALDTILFGLSVLDTFLYFSTR